MIISQPELTSNWLGIYNFRSGLHLTFVKLVTLLVMDFSSFFLLILLPQNRLD